MSYTINQVFEYFAEANGVSTQVALGMSFDMEFWENKMYNINYMEIEIPTEDAEEVTPVHIA